MTSAMKALVGNRIRQARIERGLTVDEAAESIGVVRQAVVFWESGRTYPTIENLKKLASLYQVSIDWLLADNKDLSSSDDLRHRVDPALRAASEELPPEDMKTILDLITFMRNRRKRNLAEGPSVSDSKSDQ